MRLFTPALIIAAKFTNSNATLLLRSIGLLLFAICAPVVAAQTLTVLPASQLSNAGAPIAIDIQFTPGAQPVSGFSFNLSFQANAMTYVSISPGAVASASGTSVIGAVTQPGTLNISGTGTASLAQGIVARVNFSAAGSGNPFPPVPLSMNSASVDLVGGGTASPTLNGGTLTYIDRSDVDKSGTIDVVDVQLVVNFILASTTPEFPTQGDTNGDATVDVVDVQLLVNTILNPNQPLSVLTQVVPGVTLGSPFSFSFAAVGGAQPYSWAETGQGVPGLSLSSGGALTGTATQAGTYPYSVRVTDSNSAIANQTFNIVVTQVVLQSVVITPSPITMNHNTTQQLVATGTFSDLTTADVTTQMNWTSNATGVATVGFTTGLLTGAGPGTASVTCTHPTLTSVTASVNVTVEKVLTSLAITPAAPSVVRLLTQAFTATATFSDSTTENVSSTATWASSSTNIATISSAGLASTLLAGTTNISASIQIRGVTRNDSKPLTVTQEVIQTINVAPSPASGFVGSTLQFTASGTYNNGLTSTNFGTQVTWSSGNTSAATIAASGLANLINGGITIITATRAGGGVSATSTLTVSAIVLTSITVTPTSPSITAATTQQFTAAGVYSNSSTSPNVNSEVTWSSSNNSVATINSNGLATGVAAGSTTITATRIGGGVSGSATLTVTAAQGVSYSAQIAPLWQSFGCIGCHGGSGNYFMNSHAQVVGSGANGPVIAQNNANASNLYRKLTASPPFGSRMPVGGPFMNATQLQLVADWINQGALNN